MITKTKKELQNMQKRKAVNEKVLKYECDENKNRHVKITEQLE
jgi:hypothetical protein